MTRDIVIPYSNTAGILFAEDFDALPDETISGNDEAVAADENPGAPLPPPVTTYTEDELRDAIDSAVREAVETTEKKTREAAEKEYQAKLESEHNIRIQNIENILLSVQANLSSHMEVYTTAVTRSFLEAIVTAFPQWAGNIEALRPGALLGDILPLFSGDFQVGLHLNPETVVLSKEDEVLTRFFQSKWLSLETNNSLGPDDFIMTWPDGKLSRNLDDTVNALLSTLQSSFNSSSQQKDMHNGSSVSA
ncbi:hypothetical protein [Acetobacter oeni]|uniref:Flagellar assembly protein FliH/Type III secretion system HrpE domain-containing protein n=1 Tax=Acetobacter oeni TaxID=304077 RepID=A0A511XFU5_9PROT|nr:hypothetical protein [Acetobacter oeni]MBB3882259.1 hypothetical protein [Acetobacter oeni]NHO18012.1 hypothetical protein [Acetobacter oeni]GBR01187.1 hypothetical protein AA21952_0341 [Acetobacter oeni LMG 21952]GEN61822.1 hypothetical protein AOE01nite_00460 [Acetobacter oeni]